MRRASVAVMAVWVATGASAQTGLHWVHSGTGLGVPPDAYAAGEESGRALVVCRAPFRDGVYPGKIVQGNCNIAYDGREIYAHSFDILVGSGGRWEPPVPGYGGALIAGYENGGPLFLCRAPFRGGMHPGKVYRGRCDISYAGREVPIDRFATLQVAAPIAYGDFHYPGAPAFFDGASPYRYDADADAAQRARDDRRRADLDAQQRSLDRQRADADQRARDLRDQADQERQRAAFQRNMQEQERAADDRRRAALDQQKRANDEAAAARERAAGEAEENRMALKAQAQAEAEAAQKREEAARQEEIRRGEAEENRMAAEAQAHAEAEARQKEEADRQAEIKRGEDEENRMAADAAKAADTPPQF